MTTVLAKASPEQIQQWWKSYRQRADDESRNGLLEQYLPLVKYSAERLRSRLPDEVDIDDLISAGTFGLLDALKAYDPERGVKFETYCAPRVRGAILDELRSMDWVPRLVRSRASKLNEAIKMLETRLGRHPNENELAEQMGLTCAELEKMISDANAVNLISLNKKWYETD
ncbi:MAG: sigma-70 family RNA polymerase sigma factor, partial [Phycisphaerae bacterium]|nr:sigma-70 family RNA polymerase sigma factor [Phycisphaerae bacterium]